MPQAPGHNRRQLRLHVTFEPTRLAVEQLVAAYDALLPLRRQPSRPRATVPGPAPDAPPPQAQEGA